jgi:hypothetical protein
MSLTRTVGWGVGGMRLNLTMRHLLPLARSQCSGFFDDHHLAVLVLAYNLC